MKFSVDTFKQKGNPGTSNKYERGRKEEGNIKSLESRGPIVVFIIKSMKPLQ